MKILENKFIKKKYFIIKKYICGIVLKGWEVKSIKSKCNIQIKNSFIIIFNNEIFLIKSFFTPINNIINEDISRKRKLLLNKFEILDIKENIYKKKYKIIPLNFFLKKNLIKIEISIVLKKNIIKI